MLLPKTEENTRRLPHMCHGMGVSCPSPYTLLILLYHSKKYPDKKLHKEEIIRLNLQLQAIFYCYLVVTMTGALSLYPFTANKREKSILQDLDNFLHSSTF